MTIKDIINFTDEKNSNWYANAKRDYGVVGSGKTSYDAEENEITVEYIENGENKSWSMAFYPEYLSNGIDWVFNCWSELS